MTLEQFYPLFKVLATPALKNQEAVDFKAPAYYDSLNIFKWEIFDEVVCNERDNDEHLTKELKAPAYYRRLCLELQAKKNLETKQNNHNTEIGKRPQDIAAEKEFYRTCARYSDEVGIPKSKNIDGQALGGPVHLGYAIGKYAAREVEKKTGIKIWD